MSDFSKAWRGNFSSLLSWEEFDLFWDKLASQIDDDWYVYVPGQKIPERPVMAEKAREFLLEVSALLHKEHQERYCGIVYVDDKKDPKFIKIYDPSNLGAVCGYSDNPPQPGWVLSKIAPERLDFYEGVNIVPANRQRWWQRIFS